MIVEKWRHGRCGARSGALAARLKNRAEIEAAAPRTAATARPWPSSPGSTPEAGHARRDRRGRPSSRKPAGPARKRRCRCTTSPSTPSRAPARMAPSCITASARHQPQTARRRAVPDRFRRPIPGRHDRHHPHRADRQADRGYAQRYHAGAEGHDRHFDAALPQRHAWFGYRCACAHRPVETRATIMAMAPATASAHSCLCMKGRKASAKTGTRKAAAGMILSNEPGYYKQGALWHPHRKPGVVTRGGSDRGRRYRHARFRDADARPVDKRLIDTNLLTREELLWLDDYHARVRRDRPDARRRDAGLAGEGDAHRCRYDVTKI